MNSEEIFYQLQYYNDRLTEQLNGTAEVKLTRSQLGHLANKVDNLYIKYQKTLSEETYNKINKNGLAIILTIYISILLVYIIFALVYFI